MYCLPHFQKLRSGFPGSPDRFKSGKEEINSLWSFPKSCYNSIFVPPCEAKAGEMDGFSNFCGALNRRSRAGCAPTVYWGASWEREKLQGYLSCLLGWPSVRRHVFLWRGRNWQTGTREGRHQICCPHHPKKLSLLTLALWSSRSQGIPGCEETVGHWNKVWTAATVSCLPYS